MLRRFAISFAAASTLVLGLVACDDGASGPTLDTGVPGKTQVDELTDAQAQQVCRGFERLANQIAGADVQKRLLCVFNGLTQQATGLATCDSTYSTCMRESSITGQAISLGCDSATAAALAGCQATIAEVEACANAQAATVDALLDQISCKLTNTDALRALLDETQSNVETSAIPECQALAASCPAYLGEIGLDLGGN